MMQPATARTGEPATGPGCLPRTGGHRGWTQNYLMEPGDTLQFEGDIRYGPTRLARLPIRFLPVTVFSRAGG